MNAHSKIRLETRVNVTSKGQVLIPKAIRDEAGIEPNGAAVVGLNELGQTVIMPANKGKRETPEQRHARIKTALDELCGKYPNPDGLTTDEYMRELRGDWEP